MDTKRQFTLGLFFVLTLSVLGYYTLFLTDFQLFGEQHEMVISLSEGGGLRKGDPVQVTGIRAGKVRSLAYDPTAPTDRRVTVEILLDTAVDLREDHTIRIEAATLLGGHVVSIDPGSAESPSIAQGTQLFGVVSSGALDGLGDLVADNRGRIDAVLVNLENASKQFDDILTGVQAGKGVVGRAFSDDDLADAIEAAVADAGTTFDNLGAVTDEIRNGDGLIARLLRDDGINQKTDEIIDNLTKISSDLQITMENVRSGKGAAGLLLSDEPTRERVATALAEFSEIAEKMNKGQGTVARLINDGAIADDIESLVDRIAQSDGTIMKLFERDDIYNRLDSFSADLASISNDIRTGKGTLGKLIEDEDIYNQLQTALSTVNRSLEEFREAAPVTTFTSVLFGAF